MLLEPTGDMRRWDSATIEPEPAWQLGPMSRELSRDWGRDQRALSVWRSVYNSADEAVGTGAKWEHSVNSCWSAMTSRRAPEDTLSRHWLHAAVITSDLDREDWYWMYIQPVVVDEPPMQWRESYAPGVATWLRYQL